MSQGKLGETVSVANPFDDSSEYYAEPENEPKNSYSNSSYSINENSNYNNRQQVPTYDNSNTSRGHTNILSKFGNKFTRFSQNLNSKITKMLNL